MIWQFVVASVALTLLPGPDILFVLTQSLTRGTRAAWTVALGLCSGLVFHTTAVACGVAVLLKESPTLFATLKYCGAAYLLWLGWRAVEGALKHKHQPKTETIPAPEQALQYGNYWALYRQGVTMNLLNPKVALFFLSFLPGFVDPATDSPTLSIFTLGAIFALQGLVVFSGVSVLGGWLGERLRVERWTHSVAFAGFAATLYLSIALLIVS